LPQTTDELQQSLGETSNSMAPNYGMFYVESIPSVVISRHQLPQGDLNHGETVTQLLVA